jgi:uncharacterized membrane protein YdjX (TVP38/TMEM64 family)
MTLSRKYKLLIVLSLLLLAGIGFYFRTPIWKKLTFFYDLLSDGETVKAFIRSYGMGAPVVFILLQISQVIFAPVPGEATGIIGGYLFGAAMGFLYSSIGLSIGSWINFAIGRFFGERYIRKWIPATTQKKLDRIVRHQGIFVVFLLFIIPGFPKDYLCLFLGITALPLKVFIILATIGRMPGTLMLSFQGALLVNRAYGMFSVMAVICGLLVFFAYRYRANLYRWIEQMNNRNKDNI